METGRKSLKMSHFDSHRFRTIPDLPSRILFYSITAFDYLFSYFNLIIYPLAILFCSQNWEKKHAGNGSFDSLREVEALFKSLTCFLSSGLSSDSLEKNPTPPLPPPPKEHLERIESQIVGKIFRFRSGRGGGVNNFGVILVLLC